jgi:hypothetical protein
MVNISHTHNMTFKYKDISVPTDQRPIHLCACNFMRNVCRLYATSVSFFNCLLQITTLLRLIGVENDKAYVFKLQMSLVGVQIAEC